MPQLRRAYRKRTVDQACFLPVQVAELVLEFIKALVWPSVVLTAIIVFRQRFRDLLARLTSFEGPGGVKANFTEKLAEVQERIERVQEQTTDGGTESPPPLPSPTPQPGPRPSPSPGPTPPPGPEPRPAVHPNPAELDVKLRRAQSNHLVHVDQLVDEAAKTNPDLAIIGGWRELEMFVQEAAELLGMGGQRNPLNVERAVLERLNVPRDLNAAFADLRKLRNATAHTRQRVSPAQAREYLATVSQLIATLGSYIRDAVRQGDQSS